MAKQGIIDEKELLGKLKELEGFGLLRELVERTLQTVLEAERDEHVGARSYERTETRRDIRSGYKGRTLKTGVGELRLKIPQTRQGMSSQVLPRYDRIDQSLLTMACEMYASGVSTRRVKRLLEATIGTGVSQQTVSKANVRLDAAVSALRERPLGETPVLIADARFDKVRRDGAVRSTALLVVVGVQADGHRRVLDFVAVESEKKASWKSLFSRLKKRGLKGVRFIVSDDHEGLKNAANESFVGAVWQRCQTHIARNVLTQTPKALRSETARLLRDVFHAPDEVAAWDRMRALSAWAEEKKAGWGDYIEDTLPEGFSVFALPPSMRVALRTNNMLERVNQEIKRRTKVARIFPSLSAYERLAGTILVHTDEAWQEADRKYLDVEALIEALSAKPKQKSRAA